MLFCDVVLKYSSAVGSLVVVRMVVVVVVVVGFDLIDDVVADDDDEDDTAEWNGVDIVGDVKLGPTAVLLKTFVITDRPGTGRKIPCCAPGATSADNALPDGMPFRPLANPLGSDRFFDKFITSFPCGENVG